MLRHVFSKHWEICSMPWHSCQKVSDLVENMHPGVVWCETSENDVEIFWKLLPDDFWWEIQILLLENNT